MSNSLDLLPDVTQEEDPDTKRHHDTLVYVQELARLVCPPKGRPFIEHWNTLVFQATGVNLGAGFAEDLTWEQLVTVWEYLLFEEAAPRLEKARKWVERYYKKDV